MGPRLIIAVMCNWSESWASKMTSMRWCIAAWSRIDLYTTTFIYYPARLRAQLVLVAGCTLLRQTDKTGHMRQQVLSLFPDQS